MKTIPLIILSGLEKESSGDLQGFHADAYLLKSSNISEELTGKLSELFDKNSNFSET
jgi:hypothetical protein